MNVADYVANDVFDIVLTETEDLVRDYFRRGYTCRDIHGFLAQDGIEIRYYSY